MKRYTFTWISLIALFSLIAGCGGGGPLLPPPTGDMFGNPSIAPSTPPTSDDTLNRPDYVEGEVLIVLNDDNKPTASFPFAKTLGLSLIEEIKLKWGTVYRMCIDNDQSVEAMVSTLKTYPQVRIAEPNYYYYPCTNPYYPNDPYFETEEDEDDNPWSCRGDQWGPNVIGASLCWPEYKGNPDVIVAVLDTGVHYGHEDLRHQIWINEDEIPDNGIDDDENGYIDDWHGWNFNNGNNDPMDYGGHGTPCAGVVVAEQDNNRGCTGIAPGCKVMALVMGSSSAVIQGARYAYENGASILSMSFGSPYYSEILHEEFISIWDDGNGILLAASAGNNYSTDKLYPASYPEVVKVGASYSFYSYFQRADVGRTPFSNYGEDLDILAPGTGYVTTHANYNGDWYYGVDVPGFAGTSCACPCAAACFALMKSAYPDMTAGELRQRLLETCDDLYTPGHDIESGWGRVNVWRAIYGSEPNEDIYDENGHIPHPGDGNWFFDNIFDISTSADYDFEDIFVLNVDKDGLFRLEIDIMTTGEDLDMELYDNPDLSGEPVAVFYGPNGGEKPIESTDFIVSQGPTYYLRVFSPEPYNCSNFGVKYETEPYSWWIESKSLTPGYVKSGAGPFAALKLEIYTSLYVTLQDIKAYISGNIPLNLIKNLRLYEDTNESGEWEIGQDNPVKTWTPGDLNQALFDGLNAECSYGNPLRYFIVVVLWPNDLGYDVKVGVGLRTYKDVVISEDLPLRESPFPILSRLATYREGTPPVWDTTVGVQTLEPKHELVIVYWNNATDAMNEPTTYNVYWDDDFPLEFDSDKMVEDISFSDGSTYDHAGTVLNLENVKIYHFCVRAVDDYGNEDQNEVWMQTFLAGDYDPPVWDTTVGLQDAIPGYKHVTLYWNNATDAMYEPTHYNAYWDDEFPPEISTGMMIENISYKAGGDYDHKGVVPDLGNGKTYYFCLRAADSLGNEDDNEVWLEATPGYLWDPYNPQVIGSKWLSNYHSVDVWVHGQIAYVACREGGMAIIDCTVPENPVLVDKYPTQDCQGVQYHDEQGYVYLVDAVDGLLIVDPDAVGGPELVGSYHTAYLYCHSVYVDGNLCYVGAAGPILVVLDISDPTQPQYLGETEVQTGYAIHRMILRDNYIYCVTDWKFHVVDVSDPENPFKVTTVYAGSYDPGIDLWGDFIHMTNQNYFCIYDISGSPNVDIVGYAEFYCYNGRGVAVRDNKFVYMGIGSSLAVAQWDNLDNIVVMGSLPNIVALGLFIEGEFLYVADGQKGLKIIL